MFCTNCGTSNEPGTQFCMNCGTPLGAKAPGAPPPENQPTPPLNQPPPNQPPPFQPSNPQPPPYQAPPTSGYAPYAGPMVKSKLTAGLLGVFLGWLGIHRFYLGYQNIAIAQLSVGLVGLFLSPFTCGLILLGAAIWGIVDGVMILTGSLARDGQGNPLGE